MLRAWLWQNEYLCKRPATVSRYAKSSNGHHGLMLFLVIEGGVDITV